MHRRTFLRHGTIIDGTARIAPHLTGRATTEIDCRHHIVAPGFVDIHIHVDGTLFTDPMLESFVRSVRRNSRPPQLPS